MEQTQRGWRGDRVRDRRRHRELQVTVVGDRAPGAGGPEDTGQTGHELGRVWGRGRGDVGPVGPGSGSASGAEADSHQHPR